MNFSKSFFKKGLLLSLVVLIAACSDDDPSLPPFNVNFTNTELGVSTSAEVEITFSRATETAGTLIISTVTNLAYGEDADFYTDPAIVNDELSLPFEIGAESISFTVATGSGLNIQQDETLVLTLNDEEGNAFEVGTNVSVTLTFSENFVAPSGTVELDAGGEGLPDQAFLDLSKLEQSSVSKYSWDLGFYSASGEHKVIVNNASYVMAQVLESTDIDAVSSADTTGFAAVMYVSNYVDPNAAFYIDNHNGNIDDTAIAAISATESENPVYIIKRDGDGRDWKKIRILQDGENYTIQYADIDATTHSTASVTKDELYNFTFFDLDNGVTSVEPEKDKWDLMYSTYVNRANFGAILAVGYNDYITINREGVEVAMVMTDVSTYEDFSDASDLTFEADDISVIGSTWRDVFAVSTYDDRFYVIKDGEGNIYKLKFNRMTSTIGERGFAEISYELL